MAKFQFKPSNFKSNFSTSLYSFSGGTKTKIDANGLEKLVYDLYKISEEEITEEIIKKYEKEFFDFSEQLAGSIIDIMAHSVTHDILKMYVDDIINNKDIFSFQGDYKTLMNNLSKGVGMFLEKGLFGESGGSKPTADFFNSLEVKTQFFDIGKQGLNPKGLPRPLQVGEMRGENFEGLIPNEQRRIVELTGLYRLFIKMQHLLYMTGTQSTAYTTNMRKTAREQRGKDLGRRYRGTTYSTPRKEGGKSYAVATDIFSLKTEKYFGIKRGGQVSTVSSLLGSQADNYGLDVHIDKILLYSYLKFAEIYKSVYLKQRTEIDSLIKIEKDRIQITFTQNSAGKGSIIVSLRKLYFKETDILRKIKTTKGFNRSFFGALKNITPSSTVRGDILSKGIVQSQSSIIYKSFNEIIQGK